MRAVAQGGRRVWNLRNRAWENWPGDPQRRPHEAWSHPLPPQRSHSEGGHRAGAPKELQARHGQGLSQGASFTNRTLAQPTGCRKLGFHQKRVRNRSKRAAAFKSTVHP